MFSKIFVRSIAFAAGQNLKYIHQDEEYQQMGLDWVRQTYDLVNASDWKIEKVTKNGDTVSSVQRHQIGKIYKLTCRVNYPAKVLCNEFFYNFEAMPYWNPTLVKAKMIRKIDTYTDITHNISAPFCGGIIKSRDFVNLRCCRLMVDGKVCKENLELDSSDQEILKHCCEKNISAIFDAHDVSIPPRQLSILESCQMPVITDKPDYRLDLKILNKSLVAKDITDIMRLDLNKPSAAEQAFEGGKGHVEEENLPEPIKINSWPEIVANKGRAWIIAAISVDYDKVPVTSKYIRGRNFVSGFAIHEVEGKPNECVLEWILCVDFKGSIPRYVLNAAYTSSMPEYAKCLRKYVKELHQRHLSPTSSPEIKETL